MSKKLEALLKRYAAAMHKGDAALFIGAGGSTEAGLPDWKALLRPCAEELKLDIDQENDLIALAQYYINHNGGSRDDLNQLLSKEIGKARHTTASHKIIADLPISTIWTTNFDMLIEKALRAANKNPDVRKTDADFAKPRQSDVVLYKMHGDLDRPHEVILSASDYENYAQTHPIFQNALEGDLITKTFLFLGFSFTDPNLSYMLAGLRSVLGDSKRVHYAIMRKARLDWLDRDPKAFVKWKYETNKQRLHVKDLKIRFGIRTLLVRDYDDVPEVLRTLRSKYRNQTVFVSGHALRPGSSGRERLQGLCRLLGAGLMEKELKLVADFRTEIGRALLQGALQKLKEDDKLASREYLLRPLLSRRLSNDESETRFDRSCSDNMAEGAGFTIFIGGSADDSELKRDLEVAKKHKAVLIPIGASGPASHKIWESVVASMENDNLKPMFKRLDGTLGEEQLVAAVFEIINSVTNEVKKIGSRERAWPMSRRFCMRLMKDFPDMSPDEFRQSVADYKQRKKSNRATKGSHHSTTSPEQ